MTEKPYGTWDSPISAAAAAMGDPLVEWVDFVGDEVWWIETRPAEDGRAALVRHRPGIGAEDALPCGVRSRVIEYGGRPWLGVDQGVVFVHADDQRVYRFTPGGEPTPISPPPHRPAGLRYADFARFGDEVWCVREIVDDDAGTEVERAIVALPLDGSAAADPARVRTLAAGHHFLTGPKIAPDGRRVAWLGWNHPDMPWDHTDVVVAEIRPDGTLGPPTILPGGPVSQVEWAAPDRLYVLAEPTGWWNIHEITLDGGIRPLCTRDEEFGEPLWRIGARWFVPLPGGRLAVTHGAGERTLAVLEPDGTLRDLPGPYTDWTAIAGSGDRIAAVAASSRRGRAVVVVHLADGAVQVLRPPCLPHADHLPTPRAMRFTDAAGQVVHAYAYPPHHPDTTGPAGELPPYVVHAHGGPTNRSHPIADLTVGYFTSRGIGVLDVQYGGSTGHGRAYRDRLLGNWGEVDVRDCATAARGLVAAGLADPDRIAIRGGSAGGWTAAASLTAEPELYRAAAIYFPVLDPVSWRTSGTHDFESHYLDSLIGPWPSAKDRYDELSPVNRAAAIRAPFLLMQGLDDPVCPPAQAHALLARLPADGPRWDYLTFEGERHGFGRADTIIRCLNAELSLYGRVFGFIPATG